MWRNGGRILDDLTLTLTAMAERHWTVVLLEPGTKRLRLGRTWDECLTSSPTEARTWLKHGGGIGLAVHDSGIAVLDVDVPGVLVEMCAEIGPLPPPASTSPSGGLHVYVAHRDGLPSGIEWRGRRVGDVVSGPRRQVVLPPSPYPGSEKRGVPPGGNYCWTGAIDLLLPTYELPPWWVEYLITPALPDHIERSAIGAPPEEPWDGPEPEEVVRRAMLQPGARRRAGRVKFQCPACRDLRGRDRHRDNAVVWDDGRWGCAYAPGDAEHRRAIGVALGVASRDLELAEREVDDSIAEKIMKDING